MLGKRLRRKKEKEPKKRQRAFEIRASIVLIAALSGVLSGGTWMESQSFFSRDGPSALRMTDAPNLARNRDVPIDQWVSSHCRANAHPEPIGHPAAMVTIAVHSGSDSALRVGASETSVLTSNIDVSGIFFPITYSHGNPI